MGFEMFYSQFGRGLDVNLNRAGWLIESTVGPERLWFESHSYGLWFYIVKLVECLNVMPPQMQNRNKNNVWLLELEGLTKSENVLGKDCVMCKCCINISSTKCSGRFF